MLAAPHPCRAGPAGTLFRAYVPEVLPLTIEHIQDGASASKRAVAVRTLGQVVESTGTVMGPYMEYPQLLAGVCAWGLGLGWASQAVCWPNRHVCCCLPDVCLCWSFRIFFCELNSKTKKPCCSHAEHL
jgi:hypothetical protein